ncbi:lipid-A-disaccharide synthase [Sodalinema gerasimenkoae]|uniref:lipid-A-disaccharide synthase n=1 Tax=Sodalinema gerasimenkoae TaxID=2862348 RepID=UPI00135C17DA|nr:lipid-A-disaccharide synthase [Sodalinema gerasimenkoae]
MTDILILSNGPGEVTTWVRPVVQEIRRQFPQARLSVVLSPCPHASGREAAIARSYPDVDRVQAAEDFWPFLLRGKTAENWDWSDEGVVLFLGGDRLFPVLIGRRLGYRIVVYAEWHGQWYPWVDRFAMATPEAIAQAPPRYRHKLYAVGNLMADAGVMRSPLPPIDSQHPGRIGFLPGSKPLKLSLGVPLTLEIADYLGQQRPELEFVIPVAPSLDLDQLAAYANPDQNSTLAALNWTSAQLIHHQGHPYLKTRQGTRLKLHQEVPPHNLLKQCHLCITTVGANTAELAALGVPMVVLLPTHRLDVMRAWDGLPGLLANLPGLGSGFTTLFSWLTWQWLQRQSGGTRLAWANIWAGEQIVPEFLGQFPPSAIGDTVLDFLDHPQKLEQMRQKLRQVSGSGGAAEKIVNLLDFGRRQ